MHYTNQEAEEKRKLLLGNVSIEFLFDSIIGLSSAKELTIKRNLSLVRYSMIDLCMQVSLSIHI